MELWQEGGAATRWLSYALTFALAAVLSAVLTPRVRRAAIRFGIVDRPDGRLKNHREPIPYLGGLAICLSFLLTVALTFSFGEEVLGLLLAGSIVVILGLIDDLGQLGPWTKLSGQLMAILVLIKSGIYIKLTFLPEPLAIALSVLWLVGITNAFNLIDIMDGLSAGTAMVAALVLAVVSDLNAGVVSATLLVAIAGSCLGFLKYNFEPARIFMGDTGSMFLGLLLGALAMSNSYTERNPIAALAPALILGVPIFDMLFVMVIRRLRGLPIMLGSPDHVALRLRKWRWSTRQTVVASYVATAALGGAAITMTLVSLRGALIVLGAVSAAALVVGILLKRIDMSL
ncbi:MAG: undecaprenyl/decaprenyl-phosphate alpha-N-acetylglucosaminyl 1-phosphate transferase [Acidobacteria bacterium]|nr:undecaprenyl/decaprenyl-phosphate alpha-N-acetylglucosaminyl 1-phosphate transferase [Acidobacteriota bacterium]NIM61155.1 undecaprenyl/decaprenyl-phosphate alpha-N-acetylglucosaminyl 1-phosphate transferase [Acidobacteriota bacterium]NIO58030.1 undecaprenyl/decaprenyl-phosphate alpha-N-acetylglucosaminyl 1-phosphate transferase [Acidobacteriota bacterium]NIQ29037.1 undecaprenyl/decaprenyl-phosphate alpha-N-acetylglucosaminyl 1-phosphate transferase [Acidobacteriota bacterium]NIQ83563.1 unde